MNDMPRYTHYFEVRFTKSLESDFEEFDKALQEWCQQFTTTSDLRAELLFSDQSTSSILEGIDHLDYDENEEPYQHND